MVFGSGEAFSASSTPRFGSSSAPAFGASNTIPSFSFGSTPAFYQSASAFGSSIFGTIGTTSAPFGAQSFAFGTQATTPTLGNAGFGQSAFRGQGSGTLAPWKLESISAMPAYWKKSHEELRWEDYQLGDKGGTQATTPTLGNAVFGQSTVWGQRPGSRGTPYTPTTNVDGTSYTTTTNVNGGSCTLAPWKLESISAMPAYWKKSHEELRWEDYQLGDKGTQATTPTLVNAVFGQSTVWGQRPGPGSRGTPYTPTTDLDGGSGTQLPGNHEEVEEEVDERGGGGGGGIENNCCVCMVRHKGSAFIPCGHTFCRLCSREVWVSRGKCPLCNGHIKEILDIF